MKRYHFSRAKKWVKGLGGNQMANTQTLEQRNMAHLEQFSQQTALEEVRAREKAEFKRQEEAQKILNEEQQEYEKMMSRKEGEMLAAQMQQEQQMMQMQEQMRQQEEAHYREMLAQAQQARTDRVKNNVPNGTVYGPQYGSNPAAMNNPIVAAQAQEQKAREMEALALRARAIEAEKGNSDLGYFRAQEQLQAQALQQARAQQMAQMQQAQQMQNHQMALRNPAGLGGFTNSQTWIKYKPMIIGGTVLGTLFAVNYMMKSKKKKRRG